MWFNSSIDAAMMRCDGDALSSSSLKVAFGRFAAGLVTAVTRFPTVRRVHRGRRVRRILRVRRMGRTLRVRRVESGLRGRRRGRRCGLSIYL